MKIQRLRNLTTARLHTQMSDIYEDLGFITSIDGLMTHELPYVLDTVTPWLKLKVTDGRFWDGEHDVTHIGEYPLEPMTVQEQQTYLHSKDK